MWKPTNVRSHCVYFTDGSTPTAQEEEPAEEEPAEEELAADEEQEEVDDDGGGEDIEWDDAECEV